MPDTKIPPRVKPAAGEKTDPAQDLNKIPAKVNLETFDVSVLTKEKIQDIFHTGKMPTAELIVDEIILRAAKADATDIHIEPKETEVTVRLGFDGILRRLVSLPKEVADNVSNLIKTKAGLNQFEKKKSQEGQYRVTLGALQYEVRVDTLPTIFGERAALRLSRIAEHPSTLDDLGLSGENLEKLRHLLHRPSGLVLSAGPNSSGKTKIVQACLNDLQSPETNIITLENPVDTKLTYACQTQMPSEKGLSMADILRSILKQSPNVIMLSEIRDLDTGMIAAEAVLAGTLVLSTVLSGDALSSITRLQNFELSPYWIGNSLAGIIHQRLLRRICSDCLEQYEATDEELAVLGTEGGGMFKGKGCASCNGTGYRDRIGIHEILVIDDKLRDLIYRRASFLEMKEAAYAGGFEDIRTDAVKKARAGITTPSEILRALG